MIDLNFCFPVLLRESESQSESEGIAATRVTAVVTVTKMHLKVHSASILNYDFQFDICVKEKKIRFHNTKPRIESFFKKKQKLFFCFTRISLNYSKVASKLTPQMTTFP